MSLVIEATVISLGKLLIEKKREKRKKKKKDAQAMPGCVAN
jgi:hypothetical protein